MTSPQPQSGTPTASRDTFDFEDCPWCDKAGCRSCEGTGRKRRAFVYLCSGCGASVNTSGFMRGEAHEHCKPGAVWLSALHLNHDHASLRAAVTRYLDAQDAAEQFVSDHALGLLNDPAYRVRYGELFNLSQAALAALRSAMETP